MAQSAPPRTRKPTKNPQPARAGASCRATARARRAARSPAFTSGAGRPATRGDGNPVIELEYGITVYPARAGQDPVARGLVRERQPAAVRGGVRGTAGCQAGEGHRAAGRRRAEYGADQRRPDRALPRPRPPACRPAVVPQARAHPAQAVRAVRGPGDRRRGLPGHQDVAHAAGRQRRAGHGERFQLCAGTGARAWWSWARERMPSLRNTLFRW